MKAIPLQTTPRKLPTRMRSAPFSLIARELEETERIFSESLEPFRSTVGPLLDHLRNYRGKRLRPALLLLAARAAGTLNDQHPILAASVEMIHTATLVHDDVLDSAETRRHKATFNANWGNAKSILFGDMLFSQAFALASRVDRRACARLGQTASLVCAGELRQGLEAGNVELTEETYFEIIGAKTAELTAASAELGALYAGASEDTAAKFRDYGLNLGLAFQIADDVLDLAGEESKTGKTLGTDAAQGKLTLPAIHALRTSPPAQALELKVALRSNPRTARQILIDCGSFGYAKRLAEEHANAARNALESLPPSEAKRTLMDMADWTIRREM